MTIAHLPPHQRRVAALLAASNDLTGLNLSDAGEAAAYLGFRHEDEASGAEGFRDADAKRLRLYVSQEYQQHHDLQVVGLADGVLHIATHRNVPERTLDTVRSTLSNAGFEIEGIEIDHWDRRRFQEYVRDQEEITRDSILAMLRSLRDDPENGVLVEQTVQAILVYAMQSRASDIHIDAGAEPATRWISFRVDGDLRPEFVLADTIARPVVMTIKTAANMDATRTTIPLDGRMSFRWNGQSIDVRISTLPRIPGEKLTLRLLDRRALRSFKELFGRFPLIADRLHAVTHYTGKEGKLVLVTGPTGQGKTTTLYALINHIDRSRRSVYAIDNPTEYVLPMVFQSEARDDIDGCSFADLSRAIVRHDPDVIVFGEIRDTPTVEALCRLLESGHTCLATIHSDNCVLGLERIASYLPASANRQAGLHVIGHSLAGILNQRLERLVCRECCERVPAESILGAERAAWLGLAPGDLVSVASEAGCSLCSHTGYLHRALALEALFPPARADHKRQWAELVTRQSMSDTLLPDYEPIYISRLDALMELTRRGDLDARTAMARLREHEDLRAMTEGAY